MTEAFETHHITPKASEVLKKFFVKEASEPRNYNITFDDKGFYRTLKRRVAEKLKSIDVKKHTRQSRQILDLNLLAILVSAFFASRAETVSFGAFWCLLCGQFVGWSANFAHNFIHQKDNWRMYTANISMMSWRDFRVFHVISHHMYTNTWSDLEVSNFEPHLQWMPIQIKTQFSVLYSALVSPLSYMKIFHVAQHQRFVNSRVFHKSHKLIIVLSSRYMGATFAKVKGCYIDELLSYALPAFMLLTTNSTFGLATFLDIVFRWLVIVTIGSFLYGLFAINNGHHSPEILHEGDEIDNTDFGAFQIRAIVDREEADSHFFVILAYFGQHTLHHLFPTLDHSVLSLLDDIFQETCKEFSIVPHKKTTFIEAAINQFKQLARTDIIKLK